VRKDIIEKYGDKWTLSPESYIGNGAFKMTGWEHKSVITMQKSTTYWNSKDIKITSINWQLLQDSSTALNAFEAGELDFNNGLIPSGEIPSLREQNKLTNVDLLSSKYVGINIKKPPLDNIKVRMALSIALDRNEIVKKMLNGNGKPAVAFVVAGIPGFEKSKDFRNEEGAENYISDKADINQAKELLAKAGYPDGKGLPDIEYATSNLTDNVQLAEILQEQWKKIGVNIKINSMEKSVFSAYRAEKKHELCNAGWAGDYYDPTTYMFLFLTNNPNNFFNWSNKKFDDLYEEAQSTIDQKKRHGLLHEAEKTVIEDMPVIPLYFQYKSTMINPHLKGVYQNSLGYVSFNDAYWDK
jgi:oligopeptide transport system substrate-binding protein